MNRHLLGGLAAVLLLGLGLGFVACAALGGYPAEERSAMYRLSPRHDGESFVNPTPINLDMDMGFIKMASFLLDLRRKPGRPLPVAQISASDFEDEPADFRVVWLGHSSAILDLDGVRLLIDPVFGSASPVPFVVRRFQNAPLSLNDLPRLDAVVISHDHYDHLEMSTIKTLIPSVPLFIVPLGVGAHLEKWGCPREKIVELDWWQSHRVGTVDVTATPSRHFSGRGLDDRFRTLWASFAFRGPEHSVFYTGDGGYDGRFREIGKRLGPFDLTMVECGAWAKEWPDVHLFPEESVRAHEELRGRFMLPVHWAAYDLSFHHWDDPIRLISEIAARRDVHLLTPMMGEPCVPGTTSHWAWWESGKTADVPGTP